MVYNPPKDKKGEKPIVLMLSAAELHLRRAKHVIAGVDIFTVLMEDNTISIYNTFHKGSEIIMSFILVN